MKRCLIFTLILCLACSAALAEEEQPKSVWDSIGGWFSQAAEDTSSWVSQAWSDASKWVEGAWGDASKWVEQAWNDSSTWAVEIWGDVSTWAVDTYDNASGAVSSWWTETFNNVTESKTDAWSWITEESASLNDAFREELAAIQSAISNNEIDTVKAVFDKLLSQLGLTDEDADKVWSTVRSYAEEKGISHLTAAKLALPYLFQLTVDGGNSNNGIPAIAIAQYITAIVEKLNVSSEHDANELVQQLSEILEGIK